MLVRSSRYAQGDMKKPLFGTHDFDGFLANPWDSSSSPGLPKVRCYTRAFRLDHVLFQPISQIWTDKRADNYFYSKENNSDGELQLA